MVCATCNREFPSRHYFVTHSMCNECFGRLEEEEQAEILESLMSQSSEGSAPRMVMGHRLVCTVCGHDLFWKRRTLMNTPGATFWGVEWANRQAENYVCNRCGFVMWFLLEAGEARHRA